MDALLWLIVFLTSALMALELINGWRFARLKPPLIRLSWAVGATLVAVTILVALPRRSHAAELLPPAAPQLSRGDHFGLVVAIIMLALAVVALVLNRLFQGGAS